MEIRVENIGKKFGRNWIFRNFHFQFQAGRKYAIIGNNGSGKSTLLKILAGLQLPSEGSVKFFRSNEEVPAESIFREIAFTGPYLELIEELNLKELLDFFVSFRELSVSPTEFIEILGFKTVASRAVKNYSSGMKQKVKLGLALFSDASIIMLDEPTANFDELNIQWYLKLAEEQFPDKIIIICSNQKYEYSFCHEQVDLKNFKY